jgi:hypothetical protein
MRTRGLLTRIVRLEKLAQGRPRPISDLGFSLYTERLPEWIIIPEGGRVVNDFFHHVFHNDVTGHTFRSGFDRERITFDPDDHGRDRLMSEDPVWGAIHCPGESASDGAAAIPASPPPPASAEAQQREPARAPLDVPDWCEMLAQVLGKAPSELTAADFQDPIRKLE